MPHPSSELDSQDAVASRLALDLTPKIPEVTRSYASSSSSSSSNSLSDEINELESKVDHSNFQILESSVQGFLSRILNIRVPNVRVYANTLSDSLAQKYDADALTYPDKIVFRRDKYDPRNMLGLALLGHELTHLDQFQRQDESSSSENSAIANEQKVFRYLATQPEYSEHLRSPGFIPELADYTGSPALSKMENSVPSSPIPKAALRDRDIGLPTLAPQLTNSFSPLSEQQLTSIKDEVYRDLRQRLRTEFERGS
ncbi:MAG: DUF4157 domain-containing protein [Hydrococcus sp. SU_1_0]|nr:DUF4157 domain-containing protein [Hydrococcus sp. SU_1_0]